MERNPKITNRLREVRASRGLTQEELGHASALTRQSVIAIEKGKFIPSVHTALLLARALRVRVDDLFELEDRGFRKLEDADFPERMADSQ